MSRSCGPEHQIRKHIRLLSRHDTDFTKHWLTLDASAKGAIIERATTIESARIARWRLPAIHRQAAEMSKRLLLVVPDQEFQWSRIPQRWLDFVRDERAKEKLFKHSKEDLLQFLNQVGHHRSVGFYGGIKSDESLDKKQGKSHRRERPGVGITDLWDVVRFRIVARDLLALRDIALKFWMYRFDQVVRCRNFYFRPKGGSFDTCYRAIHFELELLPERLIELQLMTESREIASLFDHSILFKSSLTCVSRSHRRWVERFGKRANICDVLDLKRGL